MINLLTNLISLIFLTLLIVLIFLGGSFLVGMVILSLFIVPLTWIYSLIVGRSYNFVIDQSGILYTLNKVGKVSLIIFIGIFIFDVFLTKFTIVPKILSFFLERLS